jgi:NADP-dependent 3-hydroxy acid dehydrogenase YdfG
VENKKLAETFYQTIEEIKALCQDAVVVRCDVTNKQSVNHLLKVTMESFGQIDVLVNNAGVASYRSIIETPLKR